MSAERIQESMNRIDRALARIETQAALVSHSGPIGDRRTATGFDAQQALREKVEASISELDALINRLEQ